MGERMELPSGLDVYGVLTAALQHPEYRAKLLTLVGFIWGFGFVVGVCFCAVFINPSKEIKRK
jgi:uncharacterized membrane protein YciS (DUF1049 family)